MSSVWVVGGTKHARYAAAGNALGAAAGLSDEQLMASCARGDAGAFDELYQRYCVYIRNFVARSVNDHGHAEDVTQEVFIRLFRSAARFDPSRQLRRWLFTIAANEIRRYWSRSSSLLSLSRNANDDLTSANFEELLPDKHEGPDELYMESVISERVRAAIAALPEHQRTALILRTYRNMTLKEISALTNTPVATVNSRLHYATERVRKAMRDIGLAGPSDQIPA